MSTYFEGIRTFFVVMLGLLLVGVLLRRRSAAVRNLAYRYLLVAALITPVIGSLFAILPGLPIATVSADTVRALPEWTPSSVMPKDAWAIRSKPRAAEHAAFERDMMAIPIFAASQILGMFLISIPTTLGWLRLRRIERTSVEVSRHTGLTVLRATDPDLGVPVTYGLPAKILLPAESSEWPAERLEAALRHEAAHVRRADWPWQNVAWTLTLMNWYNPALWLLARALRASAERAADDEVLADGLRPSDYARELLAVAARRNGLGGAGVAMVEGHGVAHRIRAILSPNRDRRRASVALASATAILVGGVTLAMGSLTTRFRTLSFASPPGMIAGSLWRGTTLPTGDAVRIVAVQEFATGRQRLWYPEGYGSDVDPPKEIDPEEVSNHRDGLYLHVEIDAASTAPRSIKILAPNGEAWTREGVPFEAGTSWLASWDVRGWKRRKEEPFSADFAVGVAAGAWSKDRFMLNPARTWRTLVAAWKDDAQAQTNVVLPRLYRDADSRYTFVAKDGRRFPARCAGWSGPNVKPEADVRSRVPKEAQIVALEVAYRPYVWTLFPNVRLEPNGDVPWRAVMD